MVLYVDGGRLHLQGSWPTITVRIRERKGHLREGGRGREGEETGSCLLYMIVESFFLTCTNTLYMYLGEEYLEVEVHTRELMGGYALSLTLLQEGPSFSMNTHGQVEVDGGHHSVYKLHDP